MARALPPSASIAAQAEGGKLHAPSAARNAAVLVDFLRQHAPDTGRALEIASGTGQHVCADLIVLVNLLHLITTPEARTLVSEAATALAPGGLLMIYGPFKRSGVLTSTGDAQFDADLRGADPLIGYKDDLDITRWLDEAGLTQITPHEMPANNLAFLARKP